MSGDAFDIGCHADGSLGHQHTRDVCADLLELFTGLGVFTLIKELRRPMSDDASEERAACELLNEHAAPDGHFWGWQDGDFGLWPSEES